MSAPNAQYLKLLEHEVQNRAFALLGCEIMNARVSEPDDVAFYDAWLAFEEHLKERYAPVAKRYGFSQEPSWSAKLQARFAGVVAKIMSENTVLKTMITQTVDYIGKLEEMERLAPESDREFAAYVVKQERIQPDVMRHRVDGRSGEGVRILRDFVAEHSQQPAFT